MHLPRIDLEIQDISKLKTMIAFNPNRDIVEDRRRKQSYKVKEIQMVFAKSSIGVQKILQVNEYYRLIFFFKYPRYSIFCLLVMLIFLITFEPKYLLSYMIALFMAFYLSYNEFMYRKCGPVINRLFFKDITPYIKVRKD